MIILTTQLKLMHKKKMVQFIGFPPTQEYLDLVSTYLPDIDTIKCVDRVVYHRENNSTHETNNFTFNLIGFPKLMAFYFDIEVVIGNRRLYGDCYETKAKPNKTFGLFADDKETTEEAYYTFACEREEKIEDMYKFHHPQP